MNKVILLVVLMSSAIITQAQPPEAFNYQAVARNLDGDPLVDQSVTFRISILQATSSGTVVYQEIHPIITNGLGVANLDVGSGVPTTGNFSTIDWSSADYFLKVELDPLGGSSYMDMGTTQLISVPYAMHAKTAENAHPAGTNGQIQYNSSGVFGAESNLFWSPYNDRLGLGTSSPSFTLDVHSEASNGMRIKTPNSAWLILDKGTDQNNSFVTFRSVGFDVWVLGTWNSNNDFMIQNWNLNGDDDDTFMIDAESSAIGLNTNSPYSTDMLGLYPGNDYSYGLYLYQNRTTAGTLYGLDAVLSSSYSGGQTMYGVYGNIIKSGTGASSKYALRGYITDDETGSTRYNYGVYGYAYVSSSSGTSYAYGVRAQAGGSATSGYGVYYSGGLAGSGTKSAVVRTPRGPREVYCQESPGNWFEDFGQGIIQNGKAIVQIPVDYLETVTISSQYPMKVFVTPNADLGNWWVEKRETSFIVHAPDATDGAGFDFRIVARRAGYEDLRLREAPAAYTDHLLYPDIKDVPAEHRAEWVRLVSPESRDPAWMSYLTAAEREQLLEEVHEQKEQVQQHKLKDAKNSTDEAEPAR